jgi:hypothetical protein
VWLIAIEKQGKQLKFKSSTELKRAQLLTRSQRFSMAIHLTTDKDKTKGNKVKKPSNPTDLKNAISIITGKGVLSASNLHQRTICYPLLRIHLKRGMHG